MKISIINNHMVEAFFLCFVLILCVSCSKNKSTGTASYENPIIQKYENTSIHFYQGRYYYVTVDADANLSLFVSEDPTQLESSGPQIVCRARKDFGLRHIWHPQIVNIQDVWYIYASADDGNTDNHRIYVLENKESDPTKGSFVVRDRIKTDSIDNWAIHPHVFEYNEELYLLWSGWQTKRVYAETQVLYIAKLENPWTLSSQRVKISEPEYEWERQWVNPDGYKTAYPVYVNEAPFFFTNNITDKLYIYYSASAMWTPYYAIGELSASKGSDLLDSSSWKKSSKPVFSTYDPSRGNVDEDHPVEIGVVYSPGYPYIIPSPDSTEYYLVYMARDIANNPYQPYSRSVRMQKINFSPEGTPDLGMPEPIGKTFKKPSGIKNTKNINNITNDESK
ncbi:GH43 family beta-xylosidase [Dysgonomonas hofstadii]|uniref:GH43 family beta-xylosidase n=1 Tax=Dysgonomonas hofstadii TaxID=637886 RepID=A0A840CMQ7_9BACT|nr:glycoside hydrolase family 43 protein [Dysgonomonas hofstadii]MBB4037270.1 GH43 family beta-xylosidase [Dysgonomonas hofstadii]